MQMIIHTSAIEQTHGFALSLRCLWMKATNILVGMRQLVTSPVYKLYTDMLFYPDSRLHFEISFVQIGEF